MERTRRAFLGGLAAGVAGLAGCTAPSRSGGLGSQGSNPEPSNSPYTRVYRQVIPSVVRIRVYDGAPISQGTGFVYDDGHLVTNEHVVAGGETVRAQFRDGEWREVSVVGTDPYSDLAALSVSNMPSYARPLSFVDSEPPVGTEVVVIGSPYGLGGSVSSGIISGQDRSLASVNDFTIADAVQTDAALNPGNSGGPMVTLDGDVAGVVTQAGGENIGFAISAALTTRVVPSLVENGEYDHPYMGVRIVGVTPLLAEANGLRRAAGVYVDGVVDGGPADGVLRESTGETTVEGTDYPTGGDVIVALDDREIRTMSDLSTHLALETSPGAEMEVTVRRDGARERVTMTLGERPDV